MIKVSKDFQLFLMDYYVIDYLTHGFEVFPVHLSLKKDQGKKIKVINEGEPFPWAGTKWDNVDVIYKRAKELISRHGCFTGLMLLCGERSNCDVIDRDEHSQPCLNKWIMPEFLKYVPDRIEKDLSQSGGNHYYFSHTPEFKNFKNSYYDMEYRSNGSLIVLPPSVVLDPDNPASNPGYSFTLYVGLFEEIFPFPRCPLPLYKFLAPLAKAEPKYLNVNPRMEGRKLTPAQKKVFEDRLRACMEADVGDRSTRDFAFVVWSYKMGLDQVKVKNICVNLIKKKFLRSDYFDRIWKSAVLAVEKEIK
jgi:Bifunctional DNA primase/polymerase, N-terminal.